MNKSIHFEFQPFSLYLLNDAKPLWINSKRLGTMDDNEVNKIVLGYLHKKGYKQTETQFKEESRTTSLENAAFDIKNDQDSTVANYILFHHSGEPTNSSVYERSYSELKRWIENSLDLYKNELDLLLYPIFVHCYLDLVSRGNSAEAKTFLSKFKDDHSKLFDKEIFKLSSVTEPIHLKDNSIANMFRSNKYNLQLSNYSFELFISFLQENQFNVLLKIINQYLNIKIIGGKPKQSWTAEETAHQFGIIGLTQRNLQSINEQKIYWGPLPQHPEVEEETLKVLKSDLTKNVKSPEQIQAVMHQLKRMKMEVQTSVSPPIDRVSVPMPTTSELIADVEKLKNFSKRATLSRTSPPSIVCYTMHNTYNAISSIQFSPDSTMMATGSSDSYIDLWSLKGEKFYDFKASTELATMNLDGIKTISELKDTVPSDRKRLVGHSGPVFTTRFSRDNRILLSCSKDGTVRLWSLDLFTNLIAYKGHRFPIWDLDYAPFGYYFASASADRTAKLWSTDCATPLRILCGHLSDVDCVKFHPNSNYVATGSSDCTIRLWDIQSGSCVRIITGHQAPVTGLAFSADGKSIASCSSDGCVNLFDLGSSKLIKRLGTHDKCVYSIDYASDNGSVATGGADNCVMVWDTKLTVTDLKDSPIGAYHTKQTPISKVHYSHRNILFVAGSYVV